MVKVKAFTRMLDDRDARTSPAEFLYQAFHHGRLAGIVPAHYREQVIHVPPTSQVVHRLIATIIPRPTLPRPKESQRKCGICSGNGAVSSWQRPFDTLWGLLVSLDGSLLLVLYPDWLP